MFSFSTECFVLRNTAFFSIDRYRDISTMFKLVRSLTREAVEIGERQWAREPTVRRLHSTLCVA